MGSHLASLPASICPFICVPGRAGHWEFSSGSDGVPVLRGFTVGWGTLAGESSDFTSDGFV